MNKDLDQILSHFKGKFFTQGDLLREKLFAVKAYIFDWDGVFNDGFKDEQGSSAFSEIDAMGTNLLRFNHYLRHATAPPVGVITGERNQAAFTLARREHFDSVYYHVKHKADALKHFCMRNELQPDEIAFVFDDVLDFSAAQICGLRIMLPRPSNPLLIDFAARSGLIDYLTSADGGHHAVRETVELLTGVSGMYEETMSGRMQYSDRYQRYLNLRNRTEPLFYTVHGSTIEEQLV